MIRGSVQDFLRNELEEVISVGNKAYPNAFGWNPTSVRIWLHNRAKELVPKYRGSEIEDFIEIMVQEFCTGPE